VRWLRTFVLNISQINDDKAAPEITIEVRQPAGWRLHHVTPEQYYAAIKKLGLTPSKVPTVFIDSEE
jgi:hypothetical protein